MRRLVAALQAFNEETKRTVLLVAVALAGLYALVTIGSMAKVTALTMLLFMSAQTLLLAAAVCYVAVIIMTRESISQQHFEPGQVIFRQGDPGDDVYVVISGEVEVIRESPGAGEHVEARLGPGDFFGEMALIRTAPRMATVRAQTPLDVMVMRRGAFLSLFTHLPALRQTFQQVVQQRMASAAGTKR
ncbi:MAG: cyclic nucleotide-binding domain-containing protein [Candidatus Rokubacteria bacterium]|nr:cyclic nucleotide-binding domain-containing protein [Candidatus Rokubacteria bacterium]